MSESWDLDDVLEGPLWTVGLGLSADAPIARWETVQLLGLKLKNDGDVKNFSEGSLERGRLEVEEEWDCIRFEVLRQKNKTNFYISFVLNEEARCLLCIGKLSF